MKRNFFKRHINSVTGIALGVALLGGSAVFYSLPHHTVQLPKKEITIYSIGSFGLIDYNGDGNIDAVIDQPLNSHSNTYRALAVAPEFADRAKKDFPYNALEIVTLSGNLKNRINEISQAADDFVAEIDLLLMIAYAVQNEHKQR